MKAEINCKQSNAAQGEAVKNTIIVFIASLLLISCAPFSRQIIRQSDEVLSVAAVQLDPGKYVNRQVLWGGFIIETVNHKDKTTIKVLRSALDLDKEPKPVREPQGRFLIEYNGFLDPYLFREGRSITVVGVITGARSLALGKATYSYPVVSAKQVHLWTDAYRGRRPPAYWNDPFWWPSYPRWYIYPYYGPFYRY